MPAIEQLLLTGNNITHHGGPLNDHGDKLPTGLVFDRYAHELSAERLLVVQW